MISLSLCMIVRDEEDVLSRCLSSVEGVFDEIIIVDTGSSDRTRGIALQFTPHIYGFQWCDDFSAARNYSFSKATMEYVMWLDADDVVSEGNRAKLVDLKKNLPPTTDVVMVKYDVAFDAYDNPTYSYYRERILKTVKQYRWVGAIHEVIQPTGNICYSDIRIQHRKTGPTDPTRNLRIYEKLLAEGKTLDPRERNYYARELMYNLQYRTAIGEYLAFLQDASGWTENKISACQDLSYCYYLVSDDEAALQSLLRSLAYDEPRAEICCDLGKHFLDRGKYIQAIFCIARECAAWIREKVQFRSNLTGGNISGFMNVVGAESTTYMPLQGFTTSDIGCERGNNIINPVNKMFAPLSGEYIRLFDQIWNDKSLMQDGSQ